MSTPPLTLADQAAQAERLLEPAVWAYLCGGAADELTLRANLSAWQRLPLWPRVLRPLAGGHTRTTLAGHALAHPILLAPVALQQLAHPEGELASALAAAAQGAGYVLSTQSSTPLEAVAQAVRGDPGRGPLWFQLYWQADRGFNRALVQRAEAAGYEAIVLTADAPVQGVRDRERRAGLTPPPGVRAVHLRDAPAAPPAAGTYCAGLPAHAPSWDDVAWLRGCTRLPVWLKGVLHPQDARQALALGVAGLIVSNHGGRTLDTRHRRRPAAGARGGAGRAAAGRRRRHPARHRRAQGRRPGRPRGAGRPAGPARPGRRRRAGRGADAAPAARRAGNGHGPDRLPHPGRRRPGAAGSRRRTADCLSPRHPCRGTRHDPGPARFTTPWASCASPTPIKIVIDNENESHLIFRPRPPLPITAPP